MEINLQDKEKLSEFLGFLKERDQWLTVVKFGLPTLIDDQLFLFELIAKRAEKESRASKASVVGYLTGIFEDLGLKLIRGE